LTIFVIYAILIIEVFPKPQFWGDKLCLSSNLIKSTFVRPIGLKKYRSLAQNRAL
jgi:hypothetical protein